MRSLLIALLALFVCSQIAFAQDMDPVMNVADDAALANAEVVFAMFEAFGSGDADGAASYMAEDGVVTIYGPAGETAFYGTFQGRDAIREMLVEQGTQFKDESFALEEVIAAGNRVVVIAHQQGHFPKGNAYDNHFILVVTVEDGLLKAIRGWEDSAQVVAGIK